MTLPDFSGLRVHVIGDAIRDVYTEARALGMASKSPTLVYETLGSQEWIGGAGVVAEHCRAAGAEVTLTTAGETIKERIVVEGVKVAEFHTRPEHTSVIPFKMYPSPDVVIYADFRHGMFTPDTLAGWREVGVGAITAADSQTTDIAWGDILDFYDCDLLFANEREARFALKDQDGDGDDLGADLLESTEEATAVFLKRGSRGLSIYHWSGNGSRLDIPPYATQPIVDPIGAGDALLAYATLTYAVTKDLQLAGEIGSLAAAEACAHLGNVPVTREAVAWRWRGA